MRLILFCSDTVTHYHYTGRESVRRHARREAQRNVNTLQEQYAHISEAAGLDERPDKMTVAGIRKVKTAEELKKPAE